jgi:hypothetical protein
MEQRKKNVNITEGKKKRYQSHPMTEETKAKIRASNKRTHGLMKQLYDEAMKNQTV